MLRWLTLLCAALALIYMLGPQSAPPDANESAIAAPPEAGAPAGPQILTLENGEAWQIDRVIATREPVEGDDGAVEIAPPVDETAAADPATDPAADLAPAPADDAVATGTGQAILYVTGTRVNLRAGPSTNDAIVTALTQGTAIELVAEAADGWFQIRDPASGSVGFMSGDFLSPTPP
ncbi:MAG: SH3 domain-containing protein [Pseudomonadota bacterium]